MPSPLEKLGRDVAACRLCPRLVKWREKVARERRAAFRDETYWGRPVPGWGDPRARLLVVGLAPAAHGANRTGRPFTGDRSGDWLYRAMHETGFATQPESTGADDGLTLTGAWVTAAVRCAPPENKPTPAEFDACRPFLERELDALPGVRAIICLGQLAWTRTLRLLQDRGAPVPRPRPRFGHGVVVDLGDGHPTVIASYHPSQQNTFTGKLTRPMLRGVFRKARELAGAS